ncbi:FadR/GntR family transcriptional regulator [Marispirochaeta sp.]|jgi:GntR family transcriptional regulator, transcriptional repressor for pyruvate dehydrogenase complex|uniref:FadR/GntR family transcriptional regulator n=1 Tax=Marispirochaeta sp. TaxID=2038653 RepID=UPI0029C842CB|nr:FadR/GntR family transcriptional regulator [Marispirochaeta sp.]
MEPITKIRLSEQVIDAVKEMIETDGFKPGDKFYSENQLCTRLKVSRSSIREAIRILEAVGRVRVEHGRGIFITDSLEETFTAFSGWLKSNEQSIVEHFEVRLMIDPKAAAYAALKADEQDIEALRSVCNKFEQLSKSKNTAGIIKCDEEFHRLLAKATKNRTLYFLMKAMTDSLSEGWISSLHTPGRIEKTVCEHTEVIDAIVARDPRKAEEAMTLHLNNALNDIRKSMSSEKEV